MTFDFDRDGSLNEDELITEMEAMMGTADAKPKEGDPKDEDGNFFYSAAVYSAAAVFLATQAIVGDGDKSSDGDDNARSGKRKTKGGSEKSSGATDADADTTALVVVRKGRSESPGPDLFDFMKWGKY